MKKITITVKELFTCLENVAILSNQGGTKMILSSSTKEKIMDVRDYYEKKDQLVDMNFMNELLTIIQKDNGFKDSFQYELIENKNYGPAYTYHGILYFNVNLLMKYIEKTAKDWFSGYPQKDMSKYYNFIALLVVLHESSHVWQQNGLEKYSEINRLNSDITHSRVLHLKNLKDIINFIRLQINIIKTNDHAYFERQANIDALRELIDMYQGYSFLDFIELQHIYNLSFKAKRESIVHDTLHAYFLEYNYNCEGIPQDLLFEVGLPTDKEYSDPIYDAIDKYYNEKLSYRRVIEKIKTY